MAAKTPPPWGLGFFFVAVKDLDADVFGFKAPEVTHAFVVRDGAGVVALGVLFFLDLLF